MITKGNKVNFYYTSKGTTDGTDSSGILFDGQNLEIHTHDKIFKGTDTNTWRNLLVDSSAKANNDTSSGGLNIVSGDDIAIEWLEPGQGAGHSGSADWSSLRISTSGLDDMAMLSPDDSCTYGADTSHGGSSTFNRFAQSWRPIKIDNEDLLDLDSSAPLNLLAGEGIELDASGSNVYINFSGDVENGAYLLEDDGSAIIPGFDAENNTVHLTPQTLSSGQMQQARSNIGALSTDSLTGYATETWVGEQGYVTDVSYLESKIGIVASSSATINAEVGKYYRYDESINSLTVNLPSVTEATTLQKIMIYFQAGASNALTLSSTDDIQYMNGYDIESGSTYEVTIMWNGYSWIVTTLQSKPIEKQVTLLEATGSTLSPVPGNYYRFTSAVTSLAVTLPTMTNVTTVQGFVVYLTTGNSISLSFSNGTVKYQDGYEIKASSTYEVNVIYNGAEWVVAAIKVV